GAHVVWTLEPALLHARLDPGVLTPGGKRGHIVEHLSFDVSFRSLGIAASLPRGHPCEALLEWLERTAVVGAVAAVAAGFDGHAAALTRHGSLLRSDGHSRSRRASQRSARRPDPAVAWPSRGRAGRRRARPGPGAAPPARRVSARSASAAGPPGRSPAPADRRAPDG